MSPNKVIALLKLLILFCWATSAYAAQPTFDQALSQITLRESILLVVLMTLAGVTALLYRISNHVNAGMDGAKPVAPIRSLPLLVSAHMCGSWLAGICAFFLARHYEMPGLLLAFFVPIVSFGGAKSLELLYNKFVADRLRTNG